MIMAIDDLLVFLRLDSIPPPRRLQVHLHQHRPLLVVGACEYGELSAGVIRGAVDHNLAALARARRGDLVALHGHRAERNSAPSLLVTALMPNVSRNSLRRPEFFG